MQLIFTGFSWQLFSQYGFYSIILCRIGKKIYRDISNYQPDHKQHEYIYFHINITYLHYKGIK